MFCKWHPEEKVKLINLDIAYEGERLVCLECLVDLSDKNTNNFIMINKLLEEPQLMLNSESLKCNISLNLKHIQEQNLEKVQYYILQQFIGIKKHIVALIEELNQKIDQFLPQYFEISYQSIDLILQQIGWSNLKEGFELLNNSEEEINLDDQITQVIKAFNSFEITDEYNELNNSVVSQYEKLQQAIHQHLELTIEQLQQSIQQFSHIVKDGYKVRYLSKFEQKRIQQEEQENLMNEERLLYQKCMTQLKMKQDLEQWQNKRFSEEEELRQNHQKQELEKIQQLQEQELNDFNYQLLKSIQTKPHFQLNNILSKCVLSDFTRPPTISQIQKYTIKEFHHFEQVIKEFQLNGDIQTYMILIQTTRHLAGCYYPQKAMLKHTILFACDSEKYEAVPFIREYQPVKLRQSENYVNEVVLRQREFEFNKDGVVYCWFCARNAKDEIKYMSIITFNQ